MRLDRAKASGGARGAEPFEIKKPRSIERGFCFELSLFIQRMLLLRHLRLMQRILSNILLAYRGRF